MVLLKVRDNFYITFLISNCLSNLQCFLEIVLGPLLLDTSPSVCHSASSALCSLISVGGDEIIQQALHQDILTPLIALMKKVPSEWIPNQQASDHIDTSVATFIETVRTLTVLSESSSESVDRLHQEKVVSMLINYLDLTKYGSDLVATVSRFLSIVTEDQGDTDYVDVLKTKIILLLETPESNLLLKSLGVGILLNLNHQCYNNGKFFYLVKIEYSYQLMLIFLLKSWVYLP